MAAFVLALGGGPLIVSGETPDAASLRPQYWARAVHIDTTETSSGGESVRLTAFSYLGIPPNNEALAPSARLRAGTRIEVARRTCDATSCVAWSHSRIVSTDALRVVGDTTLLQTALDGCEIDVRWRAYPDETAPAPDLLPGVVPPWHGEDGFWRARAEGHVCGVAVDTSSAVVG